MPNEERLDFDGARQAAMEGFDANAEAVPEAEPDVQPETAPETPPVDDRALTLAETAANKAAELDAQNRQIMEQMQLMQRQNEELKAALGEMSKANEEEIVEEAMPMLDLAGLAYEDEATMLEKQKAYAEQMAGFAEKRIMQKIAPFVEQAEAARTQNERNAVAQSLSNVPELPGFAEMLPQIERIIAGNGALRNAPDLGEAYVTAYAIAKGVDSINNPRKEPGADEFMQMYKTDAELQKLVERARAENVGKLEAPPTFAVDGGAAGAAVNVPKKPATFDEARKMLESIRV